MRVLHVANTLDPASGGTATAAVTVAIAARRAGVDVTLAYPLNPARASASAGFLSALRSEGITLRPFPLIKPLGRRAAAWAISPSLARWVDAEADKFDLLHAHSVWVMSTAAAVRAARKHRKKILVMPHEGLTRYDMSHATNPILKALKRPIRDWYLARVDRWALSSDLELRDSLFQGDARACVLAHPAFDSDLATPPRPATIPGQLTVGFIGRFHPKKNLNRLIQAIGRCPPNIRLRVAGGGEPAYEAELKALAAERKAADRIEWLGFIDANRRTEFLAGVDLLAAPSTFECFGLVAAEALAAGTPVLLSPTIGVADDIEAAGAGIITPPRDDAIAVSLIRLLEDPASLAALQSAARPTAERLYSYGAHGTALLAEYEGMLKPGS